MERISLIVDRTIEDVSRWRELHDKGWLAMTESERKEWLGFMKGRYTCDDLNRVESAVATLSERLSDLGYKHSDITVKTDWTNQDELRYEDMERYLTNIDTLRSSITIFKNTPIAPRINERLNYKLANNIEKILFDLDTVIINIQESWNCTGDVFSGEV